MTRSFTDQTQSAFNLTPEEWHDMQQTCRLERYLDHMADFLEIHEQRLGIEGGPAAAFRKEFGFMAKVRPQRIVRIPDFERRAEVREETPEEFGAQIRTLKAGQEQAS